MHLIKILREGFDHRLIENVEVKEDGSKEKKEIGISNFDVVLTIDRGVTETRVPWPLEMNVRLKTLIFPLLHHSDIFLTVILVILGEERQNYFYSISLLYTSLSACLKQFVSHSICF